MLVEVSCVCPFKWILHSCEKEGWCEEIRKKGLDEGSFLVPIISNTRLKQAQHMSINLSINVNVLGMLTL